MVILCGNVRHWQWQATKLVDECNLEEGHAVETASGHRSRFGLEWGSQINPKTRELAFKNHQVEQRLVPQPHLTMRILRERAGMSQGHLAEIVGRAQPEISMWENGREAIPDAIRYLVLGVLRSDPHLTVPHLQAGDLDRPWDEVVASWTPRSGKASDPS